MRRCIYGSCKEILRDVIGRQMVCKTHPCMVEGCNRKRVSSLYCCPHNHSYVRHGDPLAAGMIRTPIQCKTLSYEDRIRIAAFIDGEGHISVWTDNRNIINVGIGVANTNYRLIEYLLKTTGCGSVTSRRREYPCKMSHEFRIRSTNDSISILKQIRDHLILKQEQADLALRILSARQTSYRKPYTSYEKEIMIKIQDLNRKGCHSPLTRKSI